jgi:hypothetical protein
LHRFFNHLPILALSFVVCTARFADHVTLRLRITVESDCLFICTRSFEPLLHTHSLYLFYIYNCLLREAMPFLHNSSLRWVIQASFLFVAATTAAQSCYYPDGSLAPDTPCTTTSGHAACCGPAATCLDDGLCFHRGILSRGSCTDENWESEACAGYCRTGEQSSRLGSGSVNHLADMFWMYRES